MNKKELVDYVSDCAGITKIQANKAKPQSGKKSKFQKRLEDMAKQKGAQPKKK